MTKHEFEARMAHLSKQIKRYDALATVAMMCFDVCYVLMMLMALLACLFRFRAGILVAVLVEAFLVGVHVGLHNLAMFLGLEE